MAINTIPVFPKTWKSSTVRINTANANRDGTGTIGDITAAAPTSGTLVYLVKVKAEVTTTAGMIRFFIKRSGTYYFIDEMIVPATTASATAMSFGQDLHLNIKLGSGEILAASTEKAEMFAVTAFTGEYE